MSLTREQAIETLRRLEARDGKRDARDFLEGEADRLGAFGGDAAGLWFDFSKQPIGLETLEALIALADASGMKPAIAAMMGGQAVNVTEGRAAQHAALRGGGNDADRIEQAAAERARAYAFAEAVRDGKVQSASGRPFRQILHIGIGGSDLGPRLVHQALAHPDDPLDVRFLSSVDPAAFTAATHGLDPAETLVFVVSKSFSTPETTQNFAAAKAWLEAGLEGEAGAHLVAATANRDAAIRAGIAEDRLFEMWDWVGGRYSLWSAVSLSVMAAIGTDRFEALLAGARAMDAHFGSAELDRNMPVMSAVIAFWHLLIRDTESWAVVPYAMRLRLFVGWLQQLSMESLGKGVTFDGEPLSAPSGPVVWGGEGPDGQHAFFQLLHQGKDAIPVDIIAFAQGPDGARQDALLANAVAQAETLLRGRSEAEVQRELQATGGSDADIRQQAAHRVMAGGRGSTFILGKRLDAHALGALLAYYEHQTYALSVLMGLNAFDQFGVELGKKLASAIEAEIGGGKPGDHDASTRAILQRITQMVQSEGD